jgi:hypothetical protein
MATFYWVGGSGDWNATNTANWSTSSGGAGGSGPPTSGDDVIFDAGSNTATDPFTVTVTGTSSAPAVCNDFSTGGAGGALDGAMTLAFGSTGFLDCYGSMTWPATNFSVSLSGAFTTGLRFRATTTGKTFTTNGVSVTGNFNFLFLGVGGGWTLGSALTAVSSGFQIDNGTLDTGNYNVSVNSINSSSGNTRTLTLGSSSVTLAGSASPIFFTSTNFTFNAGTSTITCSNASPTFFGGGLTFYNVTFSNAGAGTSLINGANTFNDLTQTSRSGTGNRIFRLGANQTVSGTLTLGAANTAIRRIQTASDVIGTQRTITLNGSLATLADVDFRDINAAGTVATPWTGTRLGDALGNSNITFDAPKTVYWNLAGTQNWSATGWATTNNGAPAANNFPLAQDTATFTEAGAAGTINMDQSWWIGSLQMADGVSNRTTAFTFATGTQGPAFYGNVTLFSNLTLSGTASLAFHGNGITQTITSAGVSFTQGIVYNSPGGTFLIADAFTQTSTNGFNHVAGTVDLNDLTLTCYLWTSSNSNTRSIDFGSTGQITVTGNNGTVWSMSTATNFSYTGTSNVVFNYSGSTGTRTLSFTTGATESNSLNFSITAGTDIFQTPFVFKNLSFTGFSGTWAINPSGSQVCYGNLTISSGMSFSGGGTNLTFSATSGTQQITANGKTLDTPLTVNAPGATVQLQDNLTVGSTRTFTLTQGTLDLDDNKLTTGIFSSNNSNTRSIGFGTTGEIEVTGNSATVWNTSNVNTFSYTGTSKVVASYSGATGLRGLVSGAAGTNTESKAINFFITAGTDQVAISGSMKNAVFTGFSGTFLIGSAPNPRFIYGNFTFSPTATITGGDSLYTFAATSGTQEITTAGVTFDVSMAVNAPGATVQLQDALTMGSTRTLTLTAGTFDSDGYALSTGLFDGSGTTARTLSMGASTWTITGAGTAWNLSDTTNLTLNTDTSTISMTGSSPHTFQGGSQTYYNLNVGGTGDLTIVGDNTFNEISDSVDGSTVYFTAGSTTTTTAFTVDGGVGDLILLRSTTPGSVWFLEQSTGSVGITYVDIQDSDASGGATFQCINGVNSGNNTGWQFIDSGGSGGNFFIFF